MSELIHKNDNRATIRWKLLTGVSALALTAYISSANVSKADDADRPPIWIELGGQFDRINGSEETYLPPFVVANIDAPVFATASPLKAEKLPLSSIDVNGAITFQPDGSDWLFSASIRYGRSLFKKSIYRHNELTPLRYFNRFRLNGAAVYGTVPRQQSEYQTQFANTQGASGEKHSIIDFQVGKDVGLGLFGSQGTSVLSAGVRYAQFNTRSQADIDADPDYHAATVYYPMYRGRPDWHFGELIRHHFHGTNASFRGFQGMGPSLAWSASAAIAGQPQDGELALDWGVNAALLFGRQKAKLRHQESGYYHKLIYYIFEQSASSYKNPVAHKTRSRSVSVPDVGGTIGATYRIEDFKVSLGYRADFFFGALDGGIDTPKSENRAFFGPYASFSIGLGG